MSNTETRKARAARGFALLTPEQRRTMASLGGKASHAAGTGHTWTKAEAAAAGRKGGSAAKKRT